jgi:hypothetical protein
MNDGIEETNSKLTDKQDDLRFQDAAQTIFSKYQTMGIVKSSDENAVTTTISSPAHMNHHRQETIVSSRACIIL